ncbi:Alpha/Beta hydrolase protein [Russula brevipes]|nr:Alpha/Beta hydrolase protein [Russula brevipes]
MVNGLTGPPGDMSHVPRRMALVNSTFALFSVFLPTDVLLRLPFSWLIQRPRLRSTRRLGGNRTTMDSGGNGFAAGDNSAVVHSIEGTSPRWNCLKDALIKESLFYPVGTNLYNNITFMFPDANIWVIGHSLGGSLASLVGATFGVPVVTFEPPGERMAVQRLHLPFPPSTHHITHVWHTAGPIAMGTCNGVLSSYAIGEYAMESRCHLGNIIESSMIP